MAEQSKKESIRNTTLRTLVEQVGLTPQEVAQLRLSNLHLAGKSPNITFVPPDSEEPKNVELDLDAHRALVGWLVARPDSTSDFLFPGQGNDPLDQQEIETLVKEAGQTPETDTVSKPPTEPQTTSQETDATLAGVPPAGSPPPRSAPELGTPPPGMAPIGGTFTPPPTAPESGEPVSIPLPGSAPPPRPPEPVQPPQQPPAAPASAAAVAAKQSAKDSPKPEAGIVSPPKTPAQIKSKKKTDRRSSNLSRITIAGVAIVILLLCAGCIAGGWFVSQSETGGQLLARLGIAGTLEPLDDAGIMASLTPPPSTPQPTPTLPPTSSATPSATDTPLTPTYTATPVPTDTPIPDTPTPEAPAETPTDTPIPDTPTSEAPAETPTPVDTPTPAMKYGSPVLVQPKDGERFIEGNIIVLEWQPVGELAPDEQYAVRLMYQFQNQTTYQGTNLRETAWEVPPSLFRQIDGPDNLYEWFVVVERLNDDGSGTAISPESDHRTFTWK